MKRKINITCILTVVIVLFSCQNLDRELITGMTEDVFYTSWDYLDERLNTLYVDLPSGFLYIDGAMMASATDEAEHTLESASIHKFNTGEWSSLSNPDDVWSRYFKAINKANKFLENIDNINLDLYKLNPDVSSQQVYQERLAQIERYKYEARFLKAFFYFELVKRYGGVPILKKSMTYDDDFMSFSRNSLTECIQFITDECDICSQNLPTNYDSNNLGRVTKGCALALKSRVLLYAASDLFNNSSWATGYSQVELISSTGDRAAKWRLAADAAKTFIDEVGSQYNLSSNYNNIFGSSNYTDKEVIFATRAGASNNFERANYPIGYYLGGSGTTPSQNLIDAYEMTNGKSINDESSGYDPQNPYVNRDPRLSYSIITNNTSYKGRPVECWEGGLDGHGKPNATRTGYYLKKYLNESLDLLENRSSVHTWVIIRLPEIWLNYAEALNECDPGNPDIKYYVDLVRQRASVGMPKLPAGLSQAEMRERIRNERRVEFAFEDHRYWDVKRWMLGPNLFNIPLKGMKIVKNSDDSFSYQVINVENRVFEPKMYFYPIPQNDVLLTKGNIMQNPLW